MGRKWLHRVARAYGKSPDEIRAWEWHDYIDATVSVAEVPLVDEAVFAGFFKPQSAGPAIPIRNATERKRAMAMLKGRRGRG